MSQKKVDQYKQEKANRSKLMKQEKRKSAVRTGIAALVLAAIVGWIGYSAYGQMKRYEDSKVTETVMDAAAIDEYLAGVSSDAE